MRFKKEIENYILSAAKYPHARSVKGFSSFYENEEAGVDGYYTDGEIDALETPLRTALADSHSDSEFWVRSFRQGGMKDIRGVAPFAKHVVVETANVVSRVKKGHRHTKARFYHLSNDGKNFVAYNDSGHLLSDQSKMDKVVNIAICHQLWAEYNWTARFKFDNNSPWVDLMVGIGQVKKLLKMRDIPKGKKRRDAAIHFVRSHERALPADSAKDYTMVEKHLRGKTLHLWQGCDMLILPPLLESTPLKPSKKTEEVIAEIVER